MKLKNIKISLLVYVQRNKMPLISYLKIKLIKMRMMATLNPQIEKLVEQLNLLQYEENNTTVNVSELKADIL